MFEARNVFEGVYPESDYRPADEPTVRDLRAQAIAEGEKLPPAFRAIPFGHVDPPKLVEVN